MCGRFNLTASGEELAEAFGLEDVPPLSPRYNIAPTQPVAVVRLEPPLGPRALAHLSWGLVPQGSIEGERGFINARAETAWQKPAFREAFARRRCLVPATGFYEWQRTEGPRRRPWLFRLGSGGVFAFAGLWEPPAREGAPATCAILTTAPNELARAVHDRMPVILETGDYARWLDPRPEDTTPLRELLRPFPSALLEAYPVTTVVNDPRVDSPDCLRPA